MITESFILNANCQRNKRSQWKKSKRQDYFIAVVDKIWLVFLTFRDFTLDGTTTLIPDGSIVLLLNLKGPYRENKRPFETMCECLSETFGELEVLSRQEAESDEKLRELQDYWTNIDERVALYWEEREAEPTVTEMAPSDEKIPNEALVSGDMYKKQPGSFEICCALLG